MVSVTLKLVSQPNMRRQILKFLRHENNLRKILEWYKGNVFLIIWAYSRQGLFDETITKIL